MLHVCHNLSAQHVFMYLCPNSDVPHGRQSFTLCFNASWYHHTRSKLPALTRTSLSCCALGCLRWMWRTGSATQCTQMRRCNAQCQEDGSRDGSREWS